MLLGSFTLDILVNGLPVPEISQSIDNPEFPVSFYKNFHIIFLINKIIIFLFFVNFFRFLLLDLHTFMMNQPINGMLVILLIWPTYKILLDHILPLDFLHHRFHLGLL
jgi:hypothetical protein